MQARRGTIHIGTSGFSYKHWRGNFYPEHLSPAGYLAWYAGHFSATEINASFYRLPQAHTITGWSAAVPEEFRFCPKMSRYLSHMKKLRDPEEPLARFFGAFEPMREMLGPVLIQLPERLLFRSDAMQPFYELLRDAYGRYDFVMEIRHHSWLSDESLQLMKDYGIGLVIAQSGMQLPYSEEITARIVYLRFHGPRELYASAYSDEHLADIAGKIASWTSSGHDVWAFFNNDIHGFAPADAMRLKALLA